jgi:D-aminopeptidase
VQTNFGGILTINGAPVGVELGRYYLKEELDQDRTQRGSTGSNERLNNPDGSIIIVIATDAPVDARNLKRMAARAMLGLARTGGTGSNGSGDYAIAFSTSPDARVVAAQANRAPSTIKTVPNDAMSPLFLAVIEATEEAIYNSLFRAVTTTGRGRTVEALPIPKTLEILRRHGALSPTP